MELLLMFGLLSAFRTAPDEELLPGEWERDPEARKRRELLEAGELIQDEYSPGRLEVHWAPIRPAATQTPPTEPGFYARRARLTAYWQVVEVLPDANGKLWWVDGPREPTKPVMADDLYEWGDRALTMPLP